MLIKQFGLHWPRNKENLDELEDLAGHKSGIYVLYHGAMPAYIGRGAISARLYSHGKEESRIEQFWGRFSWFVIGKTASERELESLLLEALPFYIHSLNKPGGKLGKKLQVAAPSRELNDFALPRLAAVGRKRRARKAINCEATGPRAAPRVAAWCGQRRILPVNERRLLPRQVRPE